VYVFYSNIIFVNLNDKTIEFQKNNADYWVNGNEKNANVEAQIIDGKLYVELRVLTNRAGKALDYYDGYVIISENNLSEEEKAKTIAYLYYDKIESEDKIETIKEGKVYATSIDGKHIYKRIYDETKDCLYVDEYLLTIFNINMPKDAVLIQEGNYLYEEDSKILCDIDTLRQVDTRISQLNKIISGQKTLIQMAQSPKTAKKQSKILPTQALQNIKT